jgi:hypothetical protein
MQALEVGGCEAYLQEPFAADRVWGHQSRRCTQRRSQGHGESLVDEARVLCEHDDRRFTVDATQTFDRSRWPVRDNSRRVWESGPCREALPRIDHARVPARQVGERA